MQQVRCLPGILILSRVLVQSERVQDILLNLLLLSFDADRSDEKGRLLTCQSVEARDPYYCLLYSSSSNEIPSRVTTAIYCIKY